MLHIGWRVLVGWAGSVFNNGWAGLAQRASLAFVVVVVYE